MCKDQLLALAITLRWMPMPAELKALVVAVGGVVASFGLVWVLVQRMPALARVL